MFNMSPNFDIRTSSLFCVRQWTLLWNHLVTPWRISAYQQEWNVGHCWTLWGWLLKVPYSHNLQGTGTRAAKRLPYLSPGRGRLIWRCKQRRYPARSHLFCWRGGFPCFSDLKTHSRIFHGVNMNSYSRTCMVNTVVWRALISRRNLVSRCPCSPPGQETSRDQPGKTHHWIPHPKHPEKWRILETA